jgi:serine/threonine protein kinase
MEHVLKCPQCNGPLAPSRFARSVLCPYCGATVQIDEASVSAAAYREAFRAWNSPAAHGYGTWLSIGDSHWAPGRLLAQGEISEVYEAKRARWPTERVVLKILRNRSDLSAFDHEWDVLAELQRSGARGADAFIPRLPQPVVHGEVEAGVWTGSRAMVLRWAHGFDHSLEDVMRAHPTGIEARASVWVWRRTLETLSFIHASGVVHGAVIPPHLIVQEGDHGVRLVGFGHAGRAGQGLRARAKGFDGYYPAALAPSARLLPAADLAMSARSMAALLGGDPATGVVPGSVPAALGSVIRQVATLDTMAPLDVDAWSLRERLGTLAAETFGPPAFCPIPMPRRRG